MNTFTEEQTRDFYNSDDALYRSFWDRDGNCHWGIFHNTRTSYSDAQKILNDKMSGLIHLSVQSQVLDLGCGNGVNTLYLQKKTGANITGIDVSDTRIKNANTALATKDEQTKRRIRFLRSSATKLPFLKSSFTHVWSQATIYHVHNKMKALHEAYRVLKPGGIFIFDDLIMPKKRIHCDAVRYVYHRLLFTTPFSFVSYQSTLEDIGFKMIYAEEISNHLKKSYQCLIKILERKIKQPTQKFVKEYKRLITAYKATVASIDRRDLGWALYVCQKI